MKVEIISIGNEILFGSIIDTNANYIIKKTKATSLPGFVGIPLFDVIVFFFGQVKKEGMTDRASAISYNFFMAIPPGSGAGIDNYPGRFERCVKTIIARERQRGAAISQQLCRYLEQGAMRRRYYTARGYCRAAGVPLRRCSGPPGRPSP